MIITETVELNGGIFRHNYSDTNKMIRKVGTDELYCEAYDILENNFTYEEMDIGIVENNSVQEEV